MLVLIFVEAQPRFFLDFYKVVFTTIVALKEKAHLPRHRCRLKALRPLGIFQNSGNPASRWIDLSAFGYSKFKRNFSPWTKMRCIFLTSKKDVLCLIYWEGWFLPEFVLGDKIHQLFGNIPFLWLVIYQRFLWDNFFLFSKETVIFSFGGKISFFFFGQFFFFQWFSTFFWNSQLYAFWENFLFSLKVFNNLLWRKYLFYVLSLPISTLCYFRKCNASKFKAPFLQAFKRPVKMVCKGTSIKVTMTAPSFLLGGFAPLNVACFTTAKLMCSPSLNLL